MKMYAWIPKQGWFEVVDVVDYFYREDDLGILPVADVVLFDGSALRATLGYNLFYNLQGPEPRPYTYGTPGRLDTDGVEWFACDPYLTWYRWENGELHTAAHREWADGRDDYLREK